MALRKISATAYLCLPAVLLPLLLGGCFAGYWTYSAAGGGTDYASGEEHQVNYPADEAFVMTEDVLRGQGVLFDVKPEHKLLTFWKPADTPASMWASAIGVEPRYRYEIEVVPDGSHRSKIIANVRTEDIANNEIDSYKASKRLNLFSEFDQLAAKLPPPATTPGSGGVNFALLPGEDLRGIAKRVTGNPDNWNQIAKDNGLKSPADTAGIQSVWISNSLLQQANKTAAPPQAGVE